MLFADPLLPVAAVLLGGAVVSIITEFISRLAFELVVFPRCEKAAPVLLMTPVSVMAAGWTTFLNVGVG